MEATGTAQDRGTIYARISNDPTGQAAGVSRQVESCTHLAAARELRLVTSPLIDNDISAFNGARRPAYERLLAMIRNRQVDVVLVWHMDRLCRRVADLVEITRLCREFGVRIVSVSGDYDLSSPIGQMFATILIAVAEYEAAHKGERQQAAELKRAENGKRRKAGARPFGYEGDHVTERPAEAAAIRWAADCLLGGGTVSAVMRKWNADGLRPPQAPFGPLTEHPWTRSSVTTVLRNPRLAGLSAYKGEELHDGGGQSVTGQWDAIVPEPAWRAVEGKLADPSRKPRRGVRTLLGGIAACCCGNVITGGPSHRGYQVYRCQKGTRGDRPGPHVSLRADRVDGYVLDIILGVLDGDMADLVTPPGGEVDTAGLRAEAARIRAALDQMGADRALGLITRSQMIKATETGNARLAQIAAELAEAAGGGALAPFTRGDEAAMVWRDLDLSQRRAVIRELGAVITLHPAGRGARDYAIGPLVRITSAAGENLAA